MNPLASELNSKMKSINCNIYDCLSEYGKELFFPKGILFQSTQAAQKAYKFNATAGIATHNNQPFFLKEIDKHFKDLDPNEVYTYAKSGGVQELRKEWQNKIITENPAITKDNSSTPIVTQAVTHGISIIAEMFTGSRDVVVLPHVYWGNYNLIFRVKNQVEIKTYELFDDKNSFNIESFKKTLDEVAEKRDKIVIVLNSPHNPSGYTVYNNEWDEIYSTLISLANRNKKLVILCDDAYFGLFYEDTIKYSPFHYLIDAHENILSIKLDGITKEFFAWGFRVGFITYNTKIDDQTKRKEFYEALEKKTTGAIRGSISNAPNVTQNLLCRLLKENKYQEELNEYRSEIHKRCLKVKEIVYKDEYKELWEVYPFNSGYFMCLKLKNVDAEKLRVHLLDNYGVGLIAINPSILRIAFSCVDIENIGEFFEILAKACKEIE